MKRVFIALASILAAGVVFHGTTPVWAETLKISGITGVQQTESFAFAAIPARLALERGRWADAGRLEPHPGIVAPDWQQVPQSLSNVVYARALGKRLAKMTAQSKQSLAQR